MKQCLLAAMLCAAPLAVPANAAPRPVTVRIDATRQAAPVSPYLYGMFIEPIGNLMSRTLWAEMLDDRKFYFPVVDAARDIPPPLNAEGRPGTEWRRWRPIGGADAVVMDRTNPLAGEQSPSVAVGAEPRGLMQPGIALAKGRRYSGSLWISGDAGAKVSVALVWGDGAEHRQIVQLPAPAQDWARATFSFTPAADSANARIEITGTGTGQFRVASASLMPADNINGWRADTTAIARSLNSGMWRLPGGNFLSDWDWHEALGDRDKRPPMFDHAWAAMQTNDLGMDEWMELCRLLGVEPYVTVNAGLGDANSAAEQVEYLNGATTTYWGGQRAANGHAEPYRVKWWNIGNEPFGWWQIGKTSLDYYLIKHREFARKMKQRDPSILLIASGGMPDQLHDKGVKENASLESIQPKFGTEHDWTGGFLAKAWGTFDGITEHWYDRAEERPQAPPADELMEYVRSPSNHVRMDALEWEIYRGKYPQLAKSDVFLAIDEYAYMAGEPTLKSSLAYAMVFNEMLRHSDFLKMGAFTTGASTMDLTPHAAVLNATGVVFKLYGEKFGKGTIPLALDGDSPQPRMKFRVGNAHPQVEAGSPTYPIDAVAGLSPDGRFLRLAVVNATFQPQTLDLAITGASVAPNGRRWLLAGPALSSRNKAGSPAEVAIAEGRANLSGKLLKIPATSAAIYEFPILQAPGKR